MTDIPAQSSQAVQKTSRQVGMLLMVGAMLVVPMVDGIAKTLSATHSPLFISWARYACACLFVLPWVLMQRGLAFLPREALGAHALRTIFATAAMCCFFLGIANAPLADVTAAYFVGPIMAAVLSVLLLGEAMTTRKVLALVLGFGGALVVVNPGAGLNQGLLLGVASGAFFALYAIATRKASRGSDPIKTLAFQCLFGTALLTPLAVWTWTTPTGTEFLLLLLMGAISALCHFMTISAFRHAEASLLAPLSYLELVGAVWVGYLLFNEFPGVRVWIGAAIIVGAGLLLWQRRVQSEEIVSEERV